MIIRVFLLALSLACLGTCLGIAQDRIAETDTPEATATSKSPPSSNRKTSKQKLIVVQGASGTDEYKKLFEQWVSRWKQLASEDANLELVFIHRPDKETALNQLQTALLDSHQAEAIWVVLIGHGTDNRKVAKFNLVGPDISASQLRVLFSKIDKPIVLINCASSSGSFIAKLKSKLPSTAPRVLVTATKSGAQLNFARFGNYLSEAIVDPELDLDKDDQTSVLEAFLAASKRTQDFYVQEKRLATELALLDDNQDGLGTPGDWFSGTQVIREAEEGEPDGRLAARMVLVRRGDEMKLSPEQRQQRAALERQVDELRRRKKLLREDAYYDRLQALMVKIAMVYESQPGAASEPSDKQANPSSSSDAAEEASDSKG